MNEPNSPCNTLNLTVGLTKLVNFVITSMHMMISLSEDLQQFVNQQVSCGKFSQPEDVIEVAVRQMRDRARKIAEIQRAMLEEDLPDLVGLRS